MYISVFSQIPVREYLPNIIKLDTQFHRQARDTGFSLFFNRWVQEADMNNDGKLDLILQPYDHPQRRDGIVSIFYNNSTSTTPLFKNNLRNNFYTLGDVAQFTVGDVNGDSKKDLLTPTQNYHGANPPPVYLYPTGGNHTPDKFWLQRDTGFQRLVVLDNLGEPGHLIKMSDGLHRIIYNQSINQQSPYYGNLLKKYDFNHDTSALISNESYNWSSTDFLRIAAIRHIESEDPVYNYLSFEKKLTPNTFETDSLFIVSVLKSSPLNIYNAVDTIASIKCFPDSFNGYSNKYHPVDDWGIFVVDLDQDGTKEVITHEHSSYSGPLVVGSSPAHTRLQVYNNTGNVTTSWIDSDVVYDPQQISHGNGISVVDINGDGLPDLLPYTGWGWWSYSAPEYISLEPERRKKRILLNTGTRFKSFLIDFSGYTNDFINQEVGYGFPYPFPLDPNSQERSILILKGHIGGSSFLNPAWDTLSAVPALNLDFSQFKFPCSAFPPSFSLTADTLLCNLSDSALLQIDSVKGYQTRWYKNGTLLGTKHFFLARDTGTYNLVITNLGGCEASRIIRVRFAAIPNPSFSINTAAQCLTGNSFSFTNSSAIASGTLSHLWSFGDGGTATTLNATRSYTAPGTYSVKLVSTSNNGCKDSTTQQVVVNPMPAASYSVNSAVQCLTGNSFSFTNSSAIANGTLTHLWSFGDGGTATTLNATKSYVGPGTYPVKLESTSNNGCKDSTTQQVVVNPMPTSSYSINTAAQCLTGNSFNFTNSSIISYGTLTHAWTFGDGGTATTPNATRNYVAPGTYPVKLVSTSNNGCKDSITRQVTVHPMPVAGFTVSPAIQCLTGNSFSFANISTVSGGTTTSNWNFGNGSTSSNQNPINSYPNVGSYTVKLVSTSNNGCKDSTTRDVRIDPSPTATLTVAPYRSIHPGLLTTISASVAPAGTYKYAWYRNNQLISNETTTVVDSIGYRLWSGAYKMAVENLSPQLPCTYTTPELVIGDSLSNKLFIYPNPNNGQFRVTYYSPTNTRYQVVVLDTKGAVLYRKPHEVTNRYQLIDINLQGASSGLYLLQIQDPTGKQLAAGKLIIN